MIEKMPKVNLKRILETKRPMIICVKEENKEENYELQEKTNSQNMKSERK